MKFIKNAKRVISAGLSVIMLSSVMTGAAGFESFAATVPGPNQLILDVGAGPSFRKGTEDVTTNGWGSAAIEAKRTNSEYIFEVTPSNTNKELKNETVFAGVTLVSPAGGSGDRPQLPIFKTDAWPGYMLDGWYDESDNKVDNDRLVYAFQNTGTKLTAKWTGNAAATPFNLRVRHYANNAAAPIGLNDAVAASPGSISTQVPFAQNTAGNWDTSTHPHTQITLSPKIIKGYRVADVKYNANDLFNLNPSGNVYGAAAARYDATTKKITGLMPNHELKVDYVYEVDPTKTFDVRVEHIDENTGAAFASHPATTTAYATGATVNIAPANITDHEVSSVDILGATANNLNVDGTYSLEYANANTARTALVASNKEVNFKMPNQRVIVRYKYNVDASVTRHVAVQYKDNHGVTIPEAIMSPAIGGVPTSSLSGSKSVPTTYELPLPKLSGYMYPPNVEAVPTTDFAFARPKSANDISDPALRKYEYKININPSANRRIEIKYSENLSDKSFWTKVDFSSEGNKSTYVKPASKSFKKNPDPANPTADSNKHRIADLMGGDANWPTDAHGLDNYKFVGVYVKDDPSKVYDDPNDLVDLRAVADGGIAGTNGSVHLVVKFEKDPAQWAEVEFKVGLGGTLTGTKVYAGSTAQVRTTLLHTLAPTPAPRNANYEFKGWYKYDNASGTVGALVSDISLPNKPIDATLPISATPMAPGAGRQYYIAVFETVDVRAGVNIPPTLESGRASDGRGTIKVNGPSDKRKYVLTDKDGKIVASKTGQELGSGAFTGLDIGTEYKVYEVASDFVAPTDNDMDSATPAQTAVSSVVVPVITNNTAIANGTTAGTKKLTINSPASGTTYGLIDPANPSVVISPTSTSPLVFDNLSPDTTYIVVAKPNSDTRPLTTPGIMNNGSTIHTPAIAGVNPNALYKVQVYGPSGTAVTLKYTGQERLGAPIPGFSADTISFEEFKKGDRVRIFAPATDSRGWSFDKWVLNIGSTSVVIGNNDQTISVTGSDIVLTAKYKYIGSGTAPATAVENNTTIDYAPKSGNFSITQVPTQLDAYLAAIRDLADDTAYINSGIPTPPGTGIDSSKNVSYIVNYNKRLPSDTEKEKIINHLGGASAAGNVRYAFALNINVQRKKNSTSVPFINTGYKNVAFNTYAKLDSSNRGGYDYKLFAVDAGSATVNLVTTVPDLDLPSATEMFEFESMANPDITYVLTFKKRNTVKIVDTKLHLAVGDPGHTATSPDINVDEGLKLSEVTDFTNFIGAGQRDIDTTGNTEYRNATTDRVYKFAGFYKNATFAGAQVDPEDVVTESMTLYVKYLEVNDTARDAALTALDTKAQEIDDLLADTKLPNPSAERSALNAQKAALQNLKQRATRYNADRSKPNNVALPTATDINNFIASLQAPMDAAEAVIAKADKIAALTAKIAAAGAMVSGGTLSPGEASALNTAIAAASAVNNYASPETAIDAQIAALDAAIAAVGSRMPAVTALNNAIARIAPTIANPGVDPTAIPGLNTLLTQAQTLLAQTPPASAGDLNTMTNNINNAIAAALSGSPGSPGTPSPSGGSTGNGGAAGGAGGPRPGTNYTTPVGYKSYRNDIEGFWVKDADAEHKWSFNVGAENSGVLLKDTWANIVYGTSPENTKIETYVFDENGVMRSGWITDSKGAWYHLSELHDGSFGAMTRFWFKSPVSSKWYYLTPVTGVMATGWHEIEGKWYYFTESKYETAAQPIGSLHTSGMTPDGYPVDENGVWLRETP